MVPSTRVICTRSRTISTLSVRADFAGSIAGLHRAFHTLAAGEEAGACAYPQAAKRDARTIERKARRIIKLSPAACPATTLSYLRRQVPRDDTETGGREQICNGCGGP